MNLSKPPRCFDCFKHLHLDGPSGSKNGIITQTDSIEDREITVFFCNKECRDDNPSNGFNSFCEYVKKIQLDIAELERVLARKNFPEDFPYFNDEDHCYCYSIDYDDNDYCWDFSDAFGE